MDGTPHLDVTGQWGRFCRHAGMISLDAQKRIQASTVAIAGVGGIGGAVAMMCAKAGFRRLILCDRDKYELVNVVEQMFATADTVDEDKTAAAAREVKRHNPQCEVKVLQHEIRSQADADAAVDGADYVISGVDNPCPRIWLRRAAKRQQAPFLVPANIGWSVLFELEPVGVLGDDGRRMNLPGIKKSETQVDLDDARTREIVQVDWDIWIALMGDLDAASAIRLLSGGMLSYPYMAGPAFFAASFGVAQLVRFVEEGQVSEECTHPNVYSFNMKTCKALDWKALARRAERLVTAYVWHGGRKGLLDAWNGKE